MTKKIGLFGIVTSLAISVTATSAIASQSVSQYQLLMKQGMLVKGTVPVKIKLNNGQNKIIQLMQIRLSKPNAKMLANNINYLLTHRSTHLSETNLPNKKYLGMNGVPVLDQGDWGSCATFATTAAIDALFPLQNDQAVSQLCNLELGRTLNDPRVGEGGWEGAFGYIVFGQINKYGYINMQYQTQTGCGGLKQYPAYSDDNGSPMPVAKFTENSIKTFSAKDWTPVLSYDGSFVPVDPSKAKATLAKVKQSLNKGYRVVFGTLLDPLVGQAGAVGSYNNISDDTWVMTKEIKQDIENGEIAGHEIVIVGYDDNACATFDENGQQKKQCGLLRIRNSWTNKAGDKGDYYMTYDHFKGMVVEAYAIGQNVKFAFKKV